MLCSLTWAELITVSTIRCNFFILNCYYRYDYCYYCCIGKKNESLFRCLFWFYVLSFGVLLDRGINVTMLEMKLGFHSDQIRLSPGCFLTLKRLKITKMFAENIKQPAHELKIKWCSVIFLYCFSPIRTEDYQWQW